MAVRFDNSVESLSRTTVINYNAEYTWMGWVYKSARVGDYQPFLVIDAGSSNADYFTFYEVAPNLTFACYVAVGSAWTGGDVYGTSAASTWYHAAMVRESTTSLKFYVDGVLLTTLAANVAARTASTVMTMGNWSGSEQMNGRIAYVKAWTRALTIAEVVAEQSAIRPLDTTNLWGWWPIFPGAAERLLDYSGNGRNWTGTGTLTDEDPPPVSWGAPAPNLPWMIAAIPPAAFMYKQYENTLLRM
jgi:hypothetical protein